MAKPIKETPVLKGKDAVNFLQNMKEAETKKIPAEEIARIKVNAEKLKSIFQH
jgi:hypothetical protein